MKAHLTRHLFWALLVAALLFYFFGQLSGAASARDAEITANSRAALVNHMALVRYRAKLEAAETRLTGLSWTATRRADSLRLLLARGERVDTFAVFHEIAVADSEAVAACRLALGACQQRAEHAEQEAEMLTLRLADQIKASECRILFLKCPSRGLMFLGGAATGAVISGALK